MITMTGNSPSAFSTLPSIVPPALETSGRVAASPWFKDAIIYQLHVRAFCDSNGDGVGDFRGLAGRLDYIHDLGVTAIWLLPFFPSPLRDDGYDIQIDHVYPLARAWHEGAWAWPRKRRVAFANDVDLELLARLARADCLGRTGDFDCSAMDWFLERARALGVEHQPPAPLLLGRHLLDLGLTPGPRVGEILKQVYEKQLDGEIDTLDDAIAAARPLIP